MSSIDPSIDPIDATHKEFNGMRARLFPTQLVFLFGLAVLLGSTAQAQQDHRLSTELLKEAALEAQKASQAASEAATAIRRLTELLLAAQETQTAASPHATADVPATMEFTAGDERGGDDEGDDGGAAAGAAPALNQSEINDRLKAAETWIEEKSKKREYGDLILTVDWYKKKLETDEDGKKLNSVRNQAGRPLLSAVDLYKRMNAAADAHPRMAAPEKFEEAWMLEEQKFLNAVNDINGVLFDVSGPAWKVFLREWKKAVKKAAPDRFYDALRQAPMVIMGILLDFEKSHIAAAATSGGVQPSQVTGTGGTGGTGIYGYSWAAVHHARAMSRIQTRHAIRMRRITGY